MHVGKDDKEQVFLVDKDIICTRSGFFAKALKGGWKEADEGLVRLPEDDPQIFKLYLNLVYFGSIPAKARDVKEISDEDMELFKLYILSERLQDTHSQNTIIEAVHASLHETRFNDLYYLPSIPNIEHIYSETLPSSPIQQLLVDNIVHRASPGTFKAKNYSTLPGEFLHAVGQGLMKIRDEKCTQKRFEVSNYLCKNDGDNSKENGQTKKGI